MSLDEAYNLFGGKVHACKYQQFPPGDPTLGLKYTSHFYCFYYQRFLKNTQEMTFKKFTTIFTVEVRLLYVLMK